MTKLNLIKYLVPPVHAWKLVKSTQNFYEEWATQRCGFVDIFNVSYQDASIFIVICRLHAFVKWRVDIRPYLCSLFTNNVPWLKYSYVLNNNSTLTITKPNKSSLTFLLISATIQAFCLKVSYCFKSTKALSIHLENFYRHAGRYTGTGVITPLFFCPQKKRAHKTHLAFYFNAKGTKWRITMDFFYFSMCFVVATMAIIK